MANSSSILPPAQMNDSFGGNTFIPGGGGNPSGMPGIGNQNDKDWSNVLSGDGFNGGINDPSWKRNNRWGGYGGSGTPTNNGPTPTNQSGFWSSQGIGSPGAEAFFYTNKGGGMTGQVYSTIPGAGGSNTTNFALPTGSGGYTPGGGTYGYGGGGFTANGTGSSGMPGYGGVGIPGLGAGGVGAGIGQYGLGHGLEGTLNDIYGSGVGEVVNNFLQSGAGYNAQVAQALINQMQPLEARGRNRVLDAFGDEGLRFSSTAALGLGDFESQFAADEQAVLAHEYDKSVDRYQNMLTNLLDPAQANNAASGFDWGGLIGMGGDIASMFI